MVCRRRWGSEALMCEAFMTVMRDLGWTPYPETAEWDILCVHPTGAQIGVQAKLYANVDVLSQALDPHIGKPGPMVHAVLVPRASWEFRRVAMTLDLEVVQFAPIGEMEQGTSRYHAVRAAERRWASGFGFVWEHPKPHDLPPIVPDSIAGSPCPIRLTAWKQKAVRLCVRLRDRGFVTSLDFKELGMSMTYWKRGGSRSLIMDSGERDGRRFKWVARPGVRLPDDEHPALAAAIRRESDGG